MKEYYKINGYVVMAIIGLVMVMGINHITHREYIIGLFQGAGIFMFFYGIFANCIIHTKDRMKKMEDK